MKNIIFTLVASVILLAGCATERSSSLSIPQTVASTQNYSGPKTQISIGKFENRSDFSRGIFSDGVDRLGNQSKTILISHLNQTNRFSVLDRANLSEMNQETQFSNKELKVKGAKYIISGDVTEFGRKQTGDKQLFGILGKGKSQVAYAKVTINVIQADTSEVVASTHGAGEYSLSNREIVGFGGTASYDSTLNGKVLDLAIREAVDSLVKMIEQGNWKP